MKDKRFIKYIIYFILLFPFFKPEYLARIPMVSTLFNVWKVFSFFLVLLFTLKKGKLTKPLLLIIIFCAWLFLITVLKDGDVNAVFTYLMSIIALTCIVEDGTKNIKTFIKTAMFCFEIVIYINLFTIIFFPGGLYVTGSAMTGMATENYFLGFDNTHISYFLPGYIVAYIYMNLFENKKRAYALIFAIILSTFLRWSGATIVGIFLMILFTFLPFIKKHPNIFNLKNYFITSIILFLVIVIFRMQNYFEFLIVDILGKDLTFTNRTYLWDVTLMHIKESLFFGNGWQSIDIRHMMYKSYSIITAHNQILEYLYLGGLILLLLYARICWYSIKTTQNIRSNNVQVIHAGFLILQVLNLVEVYFNPVIHLVLILTLYSSRIVNAIEGGKNEKIIYNNSSI